MKNLKRVFIFKLLKNFFKDKSFIKHYINAHCYALANYLVYALQEIEKALKYNASCIEIFLFRGKLLWALNKIPEGNQEYWRAQSRLKIYKIFL